MSTCGHYNTIFGEGVAPTASILNYVPVQNVFHYEINDIVQVCVAIKSGTP
jgi:hypothetical protein